MRRVLSLSVAVALTSALATRLSAQRDTLPGGESRARGEPSATVTIANETNDLLLVYVVGRDRWVMPGAVKPWTRGVLALRGFDPCEEARVVVAPMKGGAWDLSGPDRIVGGVRGEQVPVWLVTGSTWIYDGFHAVRSPKAGKEPANPCA